ncbi:MAG: bifunctional enoyl-CoA hydratase/phosphate acetyltransferase [Parcubacteria group bacterium]
MNKAPPARLDDLIARAKQLPKLTAAIAHPCDAASIEGAAEVAKLGFIEPVLVGPEAKVRAAAQAAKADISGFRLVATPHSHASAAQAVAMVRSGEAEILVKGSLHTDELMSAVVDPECGLRTERRISHVFVIDLAAYPRLLLITDAAVNIAPTLEEKRDIVQNAIDLAHAIGVERPKVAVLSAVETVTSKLRSTIEAAALCKMADRGQIVGGELEGPLAFDNAVSLEAARDKGIDGDVAGQADVLVVPDLEAGNMLAKQLTFLAGAESAGIVLGARAPIALTSRADSVKARVASYALAALLVDQRRREKPVAG